MQRRSNLRTTGRASIDALWRHHEIATRFALAITKRLCRYVARPAVASERLSLTRQGDIRVALKTPWRDGTTHIVFAPLDFTARLVALIPRPRVNLTRFHEVFAPHSAWRAQITPARRGSESRARFLNNI